MTCRIVATEWTWSRRRGSSDVILTSNTGPLCFLVWWADQVILSDVSILFIETIIETVLISMNLKILFLFGMVNPVHA